MILKSGRITSDFSRDLYWFQVDVEKNNGQKGKVIALASDEYLSDRFKTREISEEHLKEWNIGVRDNIPKLGTAVFSLPVYFDIYATSVEGYFNALRFAQSDKTLPFAKREIGVDQDKYIIEVYTSNKVRDSVDLYFLIRNEKGQFSFVIGASGTLIASWGQYGKPREFVDGFLKLAIEKIKLELSKGNKQDGYTFTFTTDAVESTLESSIERLKNEHFSMTNEGIRREILQQAYKVWEKDPHNFLFKDEIIGKLSNVDPVAIERNLVYLEGKGLFERVENDNTGIIGVRISSYGVDVISDPKQFSLATGPSINYSVTTVNQGSGIAIVGNHNSLQNINISSFFGEVENEIQTHTDLDEATKKTLLELTQQLHKSVIQPQPSLPEIQGVMAKIKKTADWLNKKIISHPVIAQVIANLITGG